MTSRTLLRILRDVALRSLVLASALLLSGAALAPTALAQGRAGAEHPLEPADRSSPRATLSTFLQEASAAWRGALEGRPLGEQQEHERAAVRCLDLSGVAPSQQEAVGTETAVLLLDVLNRIAIPRPDRIPDEGAMEEAGETAWRLPRTSIALAKIEDGPRAGDWLFTPEVVERAKEFYRRTRHLPLKPGAAVEDGYRLFIAAPGPMIPARWIKALPDWTKRVYAEQTVWQWGGLGAVLLLVGGLARGAVRWSRGGGDAPGGTAPRRLAGPVSLLLLSGFAGHFGDAQLNLTGSVRNLYRGLFDAGMFMAAAWASVPLGHLVARAIAARPRIRRDPLNVELVKLAIRLGTGLLVLAILGLWAHSVGAPVVAVLTGLGVGGIAVALAAQRTLENFIGSLTLYADRPVRVGDFCVFGDKMGTVERIGMRSTQIRTLERSVLTIPNSEFSRGQLDNLSERDRRLLRTTLCLRLETSPEQIERLRSSIRELLLKDQRVLDDPARVELVAVGPSSIDMEIFAFIATREHDQFLAIRRQLFLRILQLVEEAGTSLAPPAQTTYLGGTDAAPSGLIEAARQQDPRPLG